MWTRNNSVPVASCFLFQHFIALILKRNHFFLSSSRIPILHHTPSVTAYDSCVSCSGGCSHRFPQFPTPFCPSNSSFLAVFYSFLGPFTKFDSSLPHWFFSWLLIDGNSSLLILSSSSESWRQTQIFGWKAYNTTLSVVGNVTIWLLLQQIIQSRVSPLIVI